MAFSGLSSYGDILNLNIKELEEKIMGFIMHGKKKNEQSYAL